MTTVLYPERRYPNDWIEREVLGRKADIRIRDVPALAALTDADRAGVTHLVLHALPATAADLAEFPVLRHVLRTGPATVAGPVLDISGHATTERADHTMAMALALHRGLIEPATLRRSSSLTFAIIGLGRVGTAVALRAKGFGFKVIFHDPDIAPGLEDALGLARAKTLQALLLQADILTLHTPDLPGLIGLPELAILPHSALVIDTTGHRTLDRTALATLLADGQIAAAALDLPPGTPAPAGRVLVTHHAAHSAEATDDLRRCTAEAIRG
jgi:C-terminal binding protein